MGGSTAQVHMLTMSPARLLASLLCALVVGALAQQSSETYELPPVHCETFSKTVVQLGNMQSPDHPLWNATTPVAAQALKAALSDAVQGLSVTTKLTLCDVAKYANDSTSTSSSEDPLSDTL